MFVKFYIYNPFLKMNKCSGFMENVGRRYLIKIK